MIRGLYAITPDWPDARRLHDAVAAAVRGGASAVQVRCKRTDAGLRREIASAVLAACRASGALCLINDDVGLALDLGADGVHVGATDTDPDAARRRLGAQAIVGVSCYDDFERARHQRSASYVAFGSVFPSKTKPGAVHAPLSLFARARQAGLDTVAIGGITRANASEVFSAGADAVAVISDLFDAPDPEAIEGRARTFHAAWLATRPPAAGTTP